MPGGELTVESLIDSFFGKLTANQWRLMISGHLEDTTAPLRQLLLDIIRTKAFLATHGETDVVTKESVKSSLGNTIIDCFKAALDVISRSNTSSWIILREMLSEEIIATVHMKLHITPPGRLDKMQALAYMVIKTIPLLQPKACTCLLGVEGWTFIDEEESSTSALPQLPSVTDVTEAKPLGGKCFGYNATTKVSTCSQGAESTIRTFIGEEESSTSALPQLPSVTGGELTVQSLIDSFFGKLTANQWRLMISGHLEDTTAPLEQLLLDIIRTTAFLLTHGETDVVTKESVKYLGNTIIDCFKAALDVTVRGKTRSATILREMLSEEIIATVQMKLHITPPGRLDKMQALAFEMITSLADRTTKMFTCSQGAEGTLPSVTDVTEAKPLGGKRFGYNASTCHDSGSACQKTIVGKQQKPDAIFLDLSESSAVTESQGKHSEEVYVKPLDQEKSVCLKSSSDEDFTCDSFVRTEAEIHEEVSSTCDQEGEDSVPSVEEEVPSMTPADLEKENKRKRFLFVFLEKLVSRTLRKCKVDATIMDHSSIVEHLMKMAWVAVKDIDFDPSFKTFANLDKTLFKNLVKKRGSASCVLVCMMVEEPAFEKLIVSAIKTHLMAWQQLSGV
ncbi:hypothetical protein EYF80_063448 [Liparis tanakae]|uniref:Uncharacterized protein n=1 Tax=Liparis tanakae TaxID=230148 RepID=A0A4Z2ECF6_9TELE|nr:hypothetical protein EYF80_063448 [Liparis tanakae]